MHKITNLKENLNTKYIKAIKTIFLKKYTKNFKLVAEIIKVFLILYLESQKIQNTRI